MVATRKLLPERCYRIVGNMLPENDYQKTGLKSTGYRITCTMPKRQAVVILPEVNYELSLVMKNVKRKSWRQSTSSPKIGILVLIVHTAWSPNTSS
jgi:hypothetical protein